ncbi:MAG: hypothetical protein FJ211_10980 [Ignavibacteria bacterium]|nr:hypothetical protein [Ignavibacteria bacterium]
MRSTANEFISKIKDADLKKATKVPDKKKGAKAEGKVYATHEPVHASLEEAMFAALACTKCVPTKNGSKGCRTCMGEHFETIRQRKARGT